jgi:peptidoglycan/xylan/chitin deacetylase (PgdA/CDA1 family)
MTTGSGVVLLYHRVADIGIDPQKIAVGTANFREHLEILQESVPVVPLGEIGTHAARHVAVTFDDGYRDNAVTAAPMLKSFDSPATFFVIAGSVGAAAPPWWARLESFCFSPSVETRTIELDVGGSKLWVDSRSRPARDRLYWALYWRLRPLSLSQIDDVLAVLSTQLGPISEPPADNLFVNSGDLAELATDELFEIGSHTVNHPLLASQPREIQERELNDSRRILEGLTGTRVQSLSYPYGGPDAFDETTVEVARSAGYRYACIVRDGQVGRDTDPLRIPRCVVRDWDRREFERRLHRWQGE